LLGAFRALVEGGEAAQFLVNDGHDLIGCAPFAAVPAPEQGNKFRAIRPVFRGLLGWPGARPRGANHWYLA
jgi:hypothetical protein